MENIVARIVEQWLARRAARTMKAKDAAVDGAAVRAARRSAQARVRRGGITYWTLHAITSVMKIDVWLFGRIPTGPFFALLRKPQPPQVADARR
jgi:hypothetical protein